MRHGPIFLTGFMATGKSRIGRVLAARLGRPFFDTDQMIEQRATKTISRIFADDGEDVFRRLESACVVETASRDDAVVALGGGAITRAENRDTIAASGGVLICVEADVDTILERVSRRDDRPLLAGLNPAQRRQKIAAMLAERAPLYGAADIRVQSSENVSVDQVAATLLARLEEMS